MAVPRKRLPHLSWMESAMRPHQCSLTAPQVQQLFRAWLAPVLGTWPPVRRCTTAVVCAVLGFAAQRLSSVADACLRLADAPDGDTVLGHLARQFADADALDR